MNTLSFLTLYLFFGVVSFIFVVEALELKSLRNKRGTSEASDHVKSLLNDRKSFKVSLAYALLIVFFPAMIIAEFFYDWE